MSAALHSTFFVVSLQKPALANHRVLLYQLIISCFASMLKLISFRTLLVLLFAISVSSCSTIVNGSKQGVTINSTPDAADIWIDGIKVGVTPAQVKLKRGKDHIVEIKKTGYQTARVTTDGSITGWFWGNLICGGIPGGAVDLITGNAYDIDPEVISVELQRGTGSIDVRTGHDMGAIELTNDAGEIIASVQISWE
jgi:hypothetical protein